MPSKTFFHLPAEKRERLLLAAEEEFARVPYAEASINRMIRAAGIPRGSFYMYFRDKVVCTPSSRQRNNLHFTHENPSCIPYGAGCYAASRRSWTSIGVRTPRPRWRRWKL